MVRVKFVTGKNQERRIQCFVKGREVLGLLRNIDVYSRVVYLTNNCGSDDVLF